MKTQNLFKSNNDLCRRKIFIAEINILRNLDENHLIQEKIVREMRKLHSLWFKGTIRDIS